MLCIGESNEDKGRKDIEEKGREDEVDAVLTAAASAQDKFDTSRFFFGSHY